METSYESDELNPFDDTPIFVLVTGATGYIAGWIIKQLLQEGYRVRGTVRSLKQKERFQHLLDINAKNGDNRLELFETTLQGSAEKWAAATKDCDYVIHVASPFPVSQPKNEQELIQPAVAGTLSVLNACLSTPTVKRVVLTSSMLAVIGGWEKEKMGKKIFTEKDWAKRDYCQPYSKSKYLAELSAWDFIKNQQPNNRNLELVTIFPGLVIGPLLSRTCGNGSRTVITRFLKKRFTGNPGIKYLFSGCPGCRYSPYPRA